jgi:LDH2 family malate/lactate/ureidoglycolate dehydrogenase
MEHLFQAKLLEDFCKTVFTKIGCSDNDAQTAAQVLVSADLRGIDSHGVARLSGYVRLWEKGRINTRPRINIVHETPSTATLDADQALGLVAAPEAMRLAIGKAHQCGTGWVAVKGSNHFGIAGKHAMICCRFCHHHCRQREVRNSSTKEPGSSFRLDTRQARPKF